MSDDIKKRRFTRFDPDQNTLTWFCLHTSEFKEEYVGLTTSEAHGGAGFIFVGPLPFEPGYYILVKTGEIGPLQAQVRWIKELDKGIFHVGIQYIE